MEDKEQIQVSDDLLRWTDRFWEDPQKILMLISLLFLGDDQDRREIPS